MRPAAPAAGGRWPVTSIRARRRGPAGEKWTTYRDAAKALREAQAQIDKGEWADPSKQPAGEYLDEWAAGLRLGASTVASYRKNIRLHLKPYLGAVPLRTLTTARIDTVYRELERSGRRDHKGERSGRPLSVSRHRRWQRRGHLDGGSWDRLAQACPRRSRRRR